MCLNPLRIKNRRKDYDAKYDKRYLYVPCNHCRECVESKSYDMEIRLVTEYQRVKNLGGTVLNYTLTYNDKFLPRYLGIPVLCRRDIQLWKKRLKKRLGDDGECLRIMYAGEYGHLKDRPHWHILIYSDKPLDPTEMYVAVKDTWDYLEQDYTKKSYIGLPSPCKNGVYYSLNDPRNAVVSSVDMIRYVAKYCFKSYNYQSYIRARLLDFVDANFHDDFVSAPAEYDRYGNLLHAEVFDQKAFDEFLLSYEFPDDVRFNFSLVKDHTLDYLTKFFGKCYRTFDYCGLAQQSMLDDDYMTTTDIRKDSNNYITYPISHYLKNRLFHIQCIVAQNSKYHEQLKQLKEECGDDKKQFARRKKEIIKDVKITHYTKKWYDYVKKTVFDAAQDFENFYICNRYFEIDSNFIPSYLPKYRYVQDYLDYLAGVCRCSLRDYYLFSTVYRSPWLCRYRPEVAILLTQGRIKCVPNKYDSDIDSLAPALDIYHDVLTLLRQQIKYAQYHNYVDDYNQRQKLISQVNQTEPRFLSAMPFEKYINHKLLSHNDVQANY